MHRRSQHQLRPYSSCWESLSCRGECFLCLTILKFHSYSVLILSRHSRHSSEYGECCMLCTNVASYWSQQIYKSRTPCVDIWKLHKHSHYDPHWVCMVKGLEAKWSPPGPPKPLFPPCFVSCSSLPFLCCHWEEFMWIINVFCQLSPQSSE